MDSLQKKIRQERLKSEFESDIETRLKEVAGITGIELKEPSETDVANYRALVDAKIASYNTESQALTTALKTALLINAGSIITLFAFLSRIWEKDSSLLGIVSPLLVFAFGIMSAAAGLFANFFQHHFFNTDKSSKAKFAVLTAQFTLLLSFVFFIYGVFMVHTGLSQYLGSQ